MIFFYGIFFARLRDLALFLYAGNQFIPHWARARNQPPENRGDDKTNEEGKWVNGKFEHGRV
jgi:hypothetical protein